MKKKILISLLIVSFFNYIGCVSTTYTLNEVPISEAKQRPDVSYILILSDGSEVSCGSSLINNANELVTTFPNEQYYLRIDKPSSMLIGSGDKIDKKTGNRSNFKGIVRGDMIDSSRVVNLNSQEYCIYWTKDNYRLSFKKGEYIYILPEQGTGFFICRPFELERIIAFNDIRKIDVKEVKSDTNWWVIGPAIGLSVALLIGIIALGKNLPHYH